ncbi:nitroreductase family protein [Eubacteriaceae bacterium ES2]|nr:nitroreductase family protein [Eubacteriaceae bacterium ES2]
MELQKSMESRVSVRSYDATTKVSQKTLEDLVKAAQLAPSWKNSQTARYYFILTESILTDFKANCLPTFNQKNAADAPVILVTTFVKNHSGFEKSGEAVNECGNGWGFYDLGLANQNLLLKASELGLKSLIMGIRNAAKIRALLTIDETEEIVSVIALGYSSAEPQRPKRKNPAEITKFY